MPVMDTQQKKRAASVLTFSLRLLLDSVSAEVRRSNGSK
jgi:hypothetical protein